VVLVAMVVMRPLVVGQVELVLLLILVVLLPQLVAQGAHLVSILMKQVLVGEQLPE
jgi:hypothetical protein